MKRVLDYYTKKVHSNVDAPFFYINF